MKDKKSTRNSDIFSVQPTKEQKPVINFLRENEISVLTGMAGTGKDFICLYRALDGLIKKEFDKIVLIKPIVEIGKSIGFLPGEEQSKTKPYEKSFYDNIVKLIGKTKAQTYKNKITFEPISFLRGNSFEYSCVIFSEAQNCTLHEIISVCTRLSKNSKMFINGDLFQSDVRNSGLKQFLNIIENVEGIENLTLGDEFQMRNPMIVNLNKEYINHLKN